MANIYSEYIYSVCFTDLMFRRFRQMCADWSVRFARPCSLSCRTAKPLYRTNGITLNVAPNKKVLELKIFLFIYVYMSLCINKYIYLYTI